MSVHQGESESSGSMGENENGWVDKGLAGAAGAGVGAVIAKYDPAAGLLAAPFVTEALLGFRSRFNEKQITRAGQVWSVAADICEVRPQALPSLADDDQKEFLLATALRAGANSSMPAKIVALGKVLADGLSNDDVVTVDSATMLAHAFDDIEVAHIRVLDYLAGDAAQFGPLGPARAVSLLDFLEDNPGYGIPISAIVATLERHGIIRTQGEPLKNMVWRATTAYSDQLPHRYRVTIFGHELLSRVREAVDGPTAAQPLVAEDEQ